MRNKLLYTEEELRQSVLENSSWRQVALQLGVTPIGGALTHLKKKCDRLNIDHEHFLGQGWRKGKEFSNEQTPIEKYLNNEVRIHSHNLKLKLIKHGFKKDECETCGVSKWMGQKVALELDHIDSNHFNNNLENLQIICPNCHAYYTRERRGYYKVKERKESNKEKQTKVSKEFNDWRSKPKLNQRKVERPSLEILLSEVKELGFSATGRKYRVSDNCIRKWIKWESVGKVDNSVLETDVK